jgi:hypothetical protein
MRCASHFFSKAALEYMLKANKRPDVIHCHEWHTGLVPVLLFEIYKFHGLPHQRVCYTIHNFRHQGLEGSWTKGYDVLLHPIERVSAQFFRKVLQPGVRTDEYRYRNALFHLLVSQTSCYRYWGQGIWVDYGREICRRAGDILTHDF